MPIYVPANVVLKEKFGNFWYLRRNAIERFLRGQDLMFVVKGVRICPLECRAIVGRASDVSGGKTTKGRRISVKERYELMGYELVMDPWCIETYGEFEFFPLDFIQIALYND